LIESELFGAVKGSYTGADATREGKFQQADGGTLFLDEIGDMSQRAQAKVLRALQEGEVEPVGGQGAVAVDVRVIAATNRDLERDVRAGRFREDLYFRLNVVPVTVPPLRERPGDVPLLAEHFLARYCDENALPLRRFHPDALRLLAGLPWPGNVRELHNAVERLAIMAAGEVVGSEDLRRTGIIAAPAAAAVAADNGPLRPLSAAAVQELGGLVEARRRFEAATIAACLAETGGNVSRAARLLNIDRTNLHKKIQAYGLDATPDEGDTP
ncbi:sigma-54-dependent Fis family transcriptional regulator, partial [bacterium]|nr:sigma-54-dependent Fis family transcriptional regulator [bacterium]